MYSKINSLALCALTSLCLMTGLALAEDKHVQEVGKSPVEVDFPSGGELRLYPCPSETVVKGTDQNKIRVDRKSVV